MIEVRHLRYFIAVAEELHFGRAAERLHMAQSPLSHQIRQLERRLGVVLLERDHHVIGMTDAGSAFLDEARAILEALDRAIERTRRAALGEVGKISVGYVPEMIADLLPHSLRAHRDCHPDVSIELSQGITGVLLDSLRQHSLDVAFVRAPGPLEDLNYEELIREDLCVALPSGHPLANRQSVRLEDLASETLVLPGYQTARGLRRDVERACSSAGLAPRAAREASSSTAMLMLVAAGAGVALVPTSVSVSYPMAGIEFRRSTEAPATSGGVCWRQAETSRLVLDFLDTTRGVVRKTELIPAPIAG